MSSLPTVEMPEHAKWIRAQGGDLSQWVEVWREMAISENGTEQPLLVLENSKTNLEILSVWEQICGLHSCRESLLITMVLCIFSYCKCFPEWYFSWAGGFSWYSLGVFLLLILPCWLAAAPRASFHPAWIICMLTCWVKRVLTVGVCSAASKGVISLIDQLYHSPPKTLQFAYVFSVYILVDGSLYLRMCQLYRNRCRQQRWAGNDKANGELAMWGEIRRVWLV